jgi:hypothetical protein
LSFDGPLRLHPVKGLRELFDVKDTDMMLDWNEYRKQLAAGACKNDSS